MAAKPDASRPSSRGLVVVAAALLVLAAGYGAAFSLLDPWSERTSYDELPFAQAAAFGADGVPFVCAYVGEELRVRTLPADGEPVSRVVRAPAGVRFSSFAPPAFAADGTRLAFAGYDGDSLGLFTMPAAGGPATRLTDLHAESPDIAFSPDGRHIAFTDRESGGPSGLDVFVIGADGTGRKQLTRDPAGDWAPAFSPDGDTIAFTSNRAGNDEIYVVQADGGVPRRLTRTPEDEHSPSFSPDGRRILFAATRDAGAAASLGTIAAGGGDPRPLTEADGNDSGPSYSPDGSRVVFVRDDGETRGVFAIDADGTDQEQLYDLDDGL